MARYFLYFCYDGTAYHGWQVQPNGITVQQVLQEALSIALRASVEVTGAGRTDSGVHAALMVAHFDVEKKLDTVWLTDKLNRLLPADVAIHGVRHVHNEAHARFSALSRTYKYYITSDKLPFRRQYVYRHFSNLNYEAMNQAAEVLFEYTDFTSFSKLHTDVKTNNCRIMHARWEQEADGVWVFTIRADRFLRNMVRAVVGTLLEVGRGKLNPDGLRRVIERKDRCSAGSSVPGHALFLVEVEYPEEIVQNE